MKAIEYKGLRPMSDDMIERVAKAIFAVTQDGAWFSWEQEARAAIEAMREPTEHMINIGACYEDPSEFYKAENQLGIRDEGDIAADVYRKMIDAALARAEASS